MDYGETTVPKKRYKIGTHLDALRKVIGYRAQILIGNLSLDPTKQALAITPLPSIQRPMTL